MPKTILFFFALVCISGVFTRPNLNADNPEPLRANDFATKDDNSSASPDYTNPGANNGHDPGHHGFKIQLNDPEHISRAAVEDKDDESKISPDYTPPGANNAHTPPHRRNTKADDYDDNGDDFGGDYSDYGANGASLPGVISKAEVEGAGDVANRDYIYTQ
ncbi:uncharacterized protein LOC108737452 isoform X1 [Agrilus planipennis]|uniref:Uncharacterized protein LOC108737452 isoform X1 n=1 Tax=Agrilus planipennis TaxID=224129 RepID=A0A1W4WPF5_AGRPL|nr:uncharacterized protein LOC108737452 isoform X1 [Agrilus planipennis]